MQQSDLNILYEDNHIIVVMKPQMVASCPDESGDYNLLDCVKDYIKVRIKNPAMLTQGLCTGWTDLRAELWFLQKLQRLPQGFPNR